MQVSIGSVTWDSVIVVSDLVSGENSVAQFYVAMAPLDKFTPSRLCIAGVASPTI
jgi:hypothetical protein